MNVRAVNERLKKALANIVHDTAEATAKVTEDVAGEVTGEVERGEPHCAFPSLLSNF